MKQDALRPAGRRRNSLLLIAGEMAGDGEVGGIFPAYHRCHRTHVFDIDSHEIKIGCSIGVAPDTGGTAEEIDLFKHANIALHRAKQNTQSEFQFYTQALNEEFSQRITLAKELRLALDAEEFIAHYQPIMDLKNRSHSCGVETLMDRLGASGKRACSADVLYSLCRKNRPLSLRSRNTSCGKPAGISCVVGSFYPRKIAILCRHQPFGAGFPEERFYGTPGQNDRRHRHEPKRRGAGSDRRHAYGRSQPGHPDA